MNLKITAAVSSDHASTARSVYDAVRREFRLPTIVHYYDDDLKETVTLHIGPIELEVTGPVPIRVGEI